MQMTAVTDNLIPVSDARAKLGKLVNLVGKKGSFVFTQRGNPKAVLVDVKLWNKLIKRLSDLYQKTYIDPKLVSYTREFTDQEISQWLKEDQL